MMTQTPDAVPAHDPAIVHIELYGDAAEAEATHWAILAVADTDGDRRIILNSIAWVRAQVAAGTYAMDTPPVAVPVDFEY